MRILKTIPIIISFFIFIKLRWSVSVGTSVTIVLTSELRLRIRSLMCFNLSIIAGFHSDWFLGFFLLNFLLPVIDIS
jgi:hypothetical protein